MRRSYLRGAFAIAFATVGSPVLAQEMGYYDQGYYDQGYYDQGYRPDTYNQGYRRSYEGRRYDRDNGPVGAAADVAGGAVTTAGAVATAPFRAFDNRDSHAMAQSDSYCARRYRSYDPASGTFMGFDGRRHPCP